jgi:hypothetical protein
VRGGLESKLRAVECAFFRLVDPDEVDPPDLAEVVRLVKPRILVGATAKMPRSSKLARMAPPPSPNNPWGSRKET